MAARHVRARSKLFACAAVAAALLAASAGAAGGSGSPGHLEVNVMNEPVRGGEPELAVNPSNPNNLVIGHTVVGNTYANNSSAAGMEAVNGGLQVSHDGGKTWTADRALHTSGYSEGPNPYLIAHGQPGGDRLHPDHERRWGSDRGERARRLDLRRRRVGPHHPDGPATLWLQCPPRRDRGGPVDGRRSDLQSDQCRLERPDVQGMVGRGMTPKGISTFGVIPFDRPWMAVDQSTGAVYVSTTGHPQRYVAVSHDDGRTWGRVEAFDCDEASRRTPLTMSPAPRIPKQVTATLRPLTVCSRLRTSPAPPPAAPARVWCSKRARMRERIGAATSSRPACPAARASSLPPTRRTRAATRFDPVVRPTEKS